MKFVKTLDSKFLKKFLKVAADELKGYWVLIGGTLLPALGIDHRVTTDIDLVSINTKDSTHATLYLLLKIRRLTESDLQDCLQWLKWVKKKGEILDKDRIQNAIHVEIGRTETTSEKRKNLEALKLKI